MTALHTTRMLARYNAWSNELIFKAVSGLPAGEATRPRTSLFRDMVHTLNHNYVIDLIFQAHLDGRKHGFSARNSADYPPLEELWRAQKSVDAWYVNWSDRLSEDDLDDKVSFEFVGGGRGAMTRAEILLHVVNHTSYHRGFVADMFFQVPARPPIMDLTVFLRDVPRDFK